MTKYFALSFHKCGTRSLSEALNSVGIKSLHHPRRHNGVNYLNMVAPVAGRPLEVLRCLAPLIASFDGHADVPWPGLYRELAETIPDSRFILVNRDLEDWWTSLAKHWGLHYTRRMLSPFERIQYRPYFKEDLARTFGLEDKELFIAAHRSHIEQVKRFLPEERLLVFDLADADKHDRLQRFLGTGMTPQFPRVGVRNVLSKFRRLGSIPLQRVTYQLFTNWPK